METSGRTVSRALFICYPTARVTDQDGIRIAGASGIRYKTLSTFVPGKQSFEMAKYS